MQTHSTLYLLLVFFLSFCPSQNLKANTRLSGTEIALGGLGCVVTGACLYKLYEWWTYEETPEELIKTSNKLLFTTQRDYGTFLTLFAPYLNDPILDEQTLCYCAQKLYTKRRFYCMPDAMCSMVKQQEEKVMHRYNKLLKTNQPCQTTLEQLKIVHEKLTNLHENLEALCTIWHDHGYYFELYYRLQEAQQRYTEDVERVLAAYDTWHLEQTLQTIVHYTPGSYAYVTYAEELKYTTDMLKLVRNKIRFTYPALQAQTQEFLQTLESFYSILVMSEGYIRNQHAQRAYQLEQERLRLERERLAHLYAWKNCYDPRAWHAPKHKETVVVVTQPAQQTQQPPITINNNINNPVCTQTVSPVVTQEPQCNQSSTVTTTPKQTPKTHKSDKQQNRWERDMHYWSSINSNFE